ncbi:hypothetical protein GWI33_007738 [Rhynchophorus ferrugineus]|uniref:Uncharacterized protein n=1 Tax=Rhynchophorus ferrugineus TaxID=354439 RepID=A0A834IRQ0_RHYFE|nr:hypothetical protein GWI33_007738 [Rhynchophorus ferrugineus]
MPEFPKSTKSQDRSVRSRGHIFVVQLVNFVVATFAPFVLLCAATFSFGCWLVYCSERHKAPFYPGKCVIDPLSSSGPFCSLSGGALVRPGHVSLPISGHSLFISQL